MLPGAEVSFEVEQIKALLPIGNKLDIELRQPNDASLDWVEIDKNKVTITPGYNYRGLFWLTLESFDKNSKVGSTLRVDKIKILVADTTELEPIKIFIDLNDLDKQFLTSSYTTQVSFFTT